MSCVVLHGRLGWMEGSDLGVVWSGHEGWLDGLIEGSALVIWVSKRSSDYSVLMRM